MSKRSSTADLTWSPHGHQRRDVARGQHDEQSAGGFSNVRRHLSERRRPSRKIDLDGALVDFGKLLAKIRGAGRVQCPTKRPKS